ncbi:2-isopropylmalate synthase [Nitzschia inconspicua]|uniref:2-isopropylmalate synthase n=1 Tax=Nitzschia inconspicua TaxID=303405 RepID=A0A9K3PAY2_9STRA|nr:2-isopropylmalate synthase [Nitzschia inconspicua]
MLSPTAVHSNGKNHSTTRTLGLLEEQRQLQEMEFESSASIISVASTSTTTPTPTTTPSPSPTQKGLPYGRIQHHWDIPLSSPPLTTPPPKSPSKHKQLSTTSPHEQSMMNSIRSPFGSNGSATSTIKGMEWKRLQPCAVARLDMASTVVWKEGTGNTNKPTKHHSSSPLPFGVLVVGGRSEELDLQAMDNVELLEWSSKRWRQLPSLNQSRCGCAVAAVETTFYIFGGVGATNLEDTSWVETLEMGGKAWIPIVTSPMPTSRWHPAAVSLPHHEEIVVLGGRDPKHWTELDTVHSFDTETHQWTSLTSMSRPRFACGATRITDSKLLVCGGYDGNEWCASCEMFDFTENQWHPVQDMPLSGLQFVTATTLTDEFVLVSGQRDDLGEGGSVWMVYHIPTNDWVTLPVFPPNVAEELVGCTLAAIGGKYVLAVGGTDADGLPTKNTRISTNVMTVVHMAMNGGLVPTHVEDVTIQSYRSNSSGSRQTDPTASTQGSRSYSQRQFAPTNSPSNLKSPKFGYCDSYPLWTGPVSHIQVVDQSSSVRSGHSLESASEEGSTQFLDCSYEDILAQYSASTGMDTASYQLISPTRSTRPKKNSSSQSIKKRETVHDIQIIDGNGTSVIYSGHVLGGRPSGKGRMTWENGDSYSGGFKHGQRHGKGCQSYANGRQYEGRFVSNYAHDPNGSMTWKDGTLYVGAFVQGKRTGNGIQRFPTGVRYEGEFVNGKYHGHGVCSFADGSMYTGEWIHGKAHGTGVLRDKHRTILYSGMWQNDSPVEER